MKNSHKPNNLKKTAYFKARRATFLAGVVLTLILFSLSLVVGLQANEYVLYDTFPGSTLNTTLWNEVASGGTLVITSGEMRVRSTIPNYDLERVDSIAMPPLEQIYNISMNFRLNINPPGSGTVSAGARIGNVPILELSKSDGASQVINDGDWLLVRNGTDFDVYDDGLYNITITPVDSNLSYRGTGNVNGGIGYMDVRFVEYTTRNNTINTSLVSPVDNTFTLDSPLTFEVNTTFIPSGFSHRNLVNSTIYVWYSNETVYNITTNLLSGNESILTTWDIEFDKNNHYKWNAYSCFNDSNYQKCKWGEVNNTFVWGLVINDSGFDTFAYETDTEIFQFNITVPANTISVSSILNYNGTSNTADVDCTGVSCSLTAEIDIPLISTYQIAQDFFFQTTIFSPSTSFTTNISSGTQTVQQIFLDECNSTITTKTLNFTVTDESSLARITPFYIAGEFDYYLGNGDTKKSLTFSNTSAIELDLCISPGNRTFNIEDTIEYNSELNGTDYVQRNYFFQDSQIDDTILEVPLFLLPATDSTSFIIFVRDNTLLPVSDALVEIQRFFVGEGVFKTVQIVRTDDNGKSVGFYKTETVDYRHVVTQDGETLLTTDSGKIIGETTPFTITLTVGDALSTPITSFQNLTDLTATIVYNNDTEIVTYTYIDTSGNLTLARLLVERVNYNTIYTTICDVNSTLTSGALTCDLSGQNGTFIAQGFVERSPGVLSVAITFVITSVIGIFGTTGLFLAWFIILTSALVFIWNPTVGIIAVNASVFFVNIIGLASFGPLWLFSMVGVSVIMLILMKT